MSEEKKYTKNEEICEEIKNLTEEDLDNVTGGLKLDPERLRKKVEEAY